jgi:hypothetical protein
MPRPYRADMTTMRLFAVALAFLTLAGPAAAAGPQFGLYDLHTDLAGASRNTYGDVQVKPRAALAGKGTLALCGASCRFGAGWLAFRATPHLAAADVSAAQASYSRRLGWHVALTLRPAAQRRWAVFAARIAVGGKSRGVPDVLVVVANGTIAASPLASQVSARHGILTLTGFSRASARAVAKLLY